MPKRHQSLEIYSPTLGIKSDVPTNIMDVRATPTGQNFKVYYGVCQKEYGTSLYATGTGSVIPSIPTFIYEAKFPNSTLLQVHTPTGVFKYTSGQDGFVSDGQIFTGSYDDFWSGVMHNDAYVYTNGIAPLQVKPSFSATGTNMASALSPTTYSAFSILSLRDHLIMYHVFENGSEKYKRVQWSKKGALTYTAGTTDFASGVAGAVDVQDCEGEIKTAVPLSGGAAIYAERSIHYQYWVGGDEVWRFQKTVPGIGTPGRMTVISYGDINYFLGHDNVYSYEGGSEPKPIGNPIKQALFSEINRSAIANAFLEFDSQENELVVAIPVGSDTMPTVNWVYRVQDDAWTRKLRNHTSAGRSSRRSGLTIGDLVGNIGAQNFTFGEAVVRVDAEVRVYGQPSGHVVQHDVSRYSLSESGTNVAQVFHVETPDVTGTRAIDPVDSDRAQFVTTNQRWQKFWLEIFGTGQTIVSVSTDRGSTFIPVSASPISLNPSGTTHEIDVDVSNSFIRFALEQTGTNDFIGWRYAKLDFIPGGNS